MAQRRMLSKRISQSKKVNRLPLKAQVVYTWTIPWLDDYGCYTGDPEDIKTEVFPKNKKISVKDIENALSKLATISLIAWYHIGNGELVQQYQNFDSFQTFKSDRPRMSEYPQYQPDNRDISPVGNQKIPEGSLSKVKLSKEKLNKDEPNTTVVFEKWNSYKCKKWKFHPKLSYEIKQAITEQLKHYSADDLCGAVENYAKILLGSDFKWSYAWTLQQFLTRTSPTNRKEQQLWRFLPNNYHDEDYLTESAIKRRVGQRKEFYEFIVNCDEQKLIEAYRQNKNNLNWLIEELRPEIKGKSDE